MTEYETTKSGDWDDLRTWKDGKVPPITLKEDELRLERLLKRVKESGATVTIKSGHVVTIRKDSS